MTNPPTVNLKNPPDVDKIIEEIKRYKDGSRKAFSLLFKVDFNDFNQLSFEISKLGSAEIYNIKYEGDKVMVEVKIFPIGDRGIV